MREQQGVASRAGSSKGRLGAGMTATYNDDIK
jgi:hypothetical protein